MSTIILNPNAFNVDLGPQFYVDAIGAHQGLIVTDAQPAVQAALDTLGLGLTSSVVSSGAAVAALGVGSPEGVFTAPPGSIYWDTAAHLFYVKQSGVGNVGWVVQTAPPSAFVVTSIKVSAYAPALGELVPCNSAGGGFTVTLPAVTGPSVGRSIIIKKVSADANVVAVVPSGGDTVEGALSFAIATPRGTATFVSNGSGAGNWMAT